jgi:RPA family protein
MSQSNQSRPQRKEAVRTFAPEFNEAEIEFKDPDEIEEQGEERAANYVLLPTGDRANRVLMCGSLTETTEVNEKIIRARLVDETGENFFVYAGQRYNQDEYGQLGRLEAPEHLMIIGKPSTYTTDEGDTYVSIDPEEIIVTDQETRERWATETAEHTLDRIEALKAGDAPHGEEAETHYDYDLSELRDHVENVLDELAAGSDDSETAEDEDEPEAESEVADADPEAAAA